MNIEERRLIKGVVLVDYVRMIRTHKSVDWEKYLRPDDFQIMKKGVSDTAWYPFPTLERMSTGIVSELAKDDMDMVRMWGRAAMDRLVFYDKSLVCESEPMESLMRFKIFRDGLFNFDPIRVMLVTVANARFEINFGMQGIAEKASAYHILGYIERLLQLSEARDIGYEFNKKIWEGAPATELEVNWDDYTFEKRVRGALFLDYIRMIKSRKNIAWDKYLQPEDAIYLEKQIKEEEWYPFATFARMGFAIVSEYSKGNVEPVRIWGRESAKKLIDANKTVLSKGDPMESLMRFQILRNSYFDFDPIHLSYIVPSFARFEICYGIPNIEAEKAATYQALGYFEALLEVSGAQNINHKFTQTIWDLQQATVLEMSWE